VESPHDNASMGPFILLSSYKVFRYAVNNMHVLNSACNVSGRFVGFSTNLGFLQNQVSGKFIQWEPGPYIRKDGPTDKKLMGTTFEPKRRRLKT